MVDIRQTKEYARYLTSLGWKVERINSTNYFLKKIFPLGYILKVQRPKTIDFKTIKTLEKKYKVFQTIIEPDLGPNTVPKKDSVHDLIISRGFKLSKSPYLPSKTIHIVLTHNINVIIKAMNKNTRYSVKKSKGVEIREVTSFSDLKHFHKSWKKSVKFSRFVPSLDQLNKLVTSFTQNPPLILSSHNNVGKIIGGAIFTRSHKDFSYYWYGFTSSEGRTSLSQYSLLYQGILWGKRMGCKIFDMEGIFDDRFPQKSWLGFTHFKKGFGGKEILYPGCYTKLNLFNTNQ